MPTTRQRQIEGLANRAERGPLIRLKAATTLLREKEKEVLTCG